MANPGQNAVIQDWDGAAGAKWVAHQARLDRMLAPLGEAAMAAVGVQPGDHILDVGCGAGTTSIALAERTGGAGHVLGLDISPDLIAAARSNARALPQLDFRLGDAAGAALPAASFDLLFSRFGVMFFDEPAAAFDHMRRALKPGARLSFVCWRNPRDNDWIRLPLQAIDGLVDLPPTDPLAPGPFAFADAARTESILHAAGFADISITAHDCQLPYGSGADDAAALDDAMSMALTIGPLARAVALVGDDIRTKAEVRLRDILRERVRDGSIYFDSAAWIVTARSE